MTIPKSGTEQLAPIQHENLHQRVYVQMRAAIMAGKFKPGEVLTLRGLAAALGTSIMPARDAVLRLVAERALDARGRSFRVPILSFAQLRDIERFRMLLEGEAAALAAERASAKQIDGIIKCMGDAEKGRQSGNTQRMLNANQAFHFAVYQAANNDMLVSMIETLWLQIGPHLSKVTATFDGSDLTKIDLSAHDQLVAALRARDGAAARAAIVLDLQDSVDKYQQYRVDEENLETGTEAPGHPVLALAGQNAAR